MTLNIAVIYGSVRDERQGIHVANFLVKELEKRKHEVTLMDPKKYELPFLNKMYKEYEEGKAPKVMQEVHKIVQKADAYVIVSGEYNHSVPPALKNLLDHFQQEYFFKPAGICTYSAGPFAGMRVAVHLRAILGELGMVTPSTMFAVSKVGNFSDEISTYERRVVQFLNELEWYGTIMKEGKEKHNTPF